MFPDLGGVAVCRGCPTGPSSVSSLVTRANTPEVAPVGHVGSSDSGPTLVGGACPQAGGCRPLVGGARPWAAGCGGPSPGGSTTSMPLE